MDPNSSIIITAQHPSYNNAFIDGANALEPFFKYETDNLSGDDDHDEVTYRPRPQLPKPFVGMRSLAHLIKDLDEGVIQDDPEYQREVVWTAERMTGLINSLMENFYIPPIVLNKKTHSASKSGSAIKDKFVCVDGKQRLSSVRAFVKGMIPCHDFNGDKWWFSDTSTSRRRKVLPLEMQNIFLSKEFVSFEFKDLSQEQEEDLFARVQMGVQLSLAEKMRASIGPWQELARLFVDDFPIIYSLMKDRARAKDFQLTLSCFSQIIEVQHPTASDGVPILKTNYNALPKLLSNKGAVDDGIKSHLAGVWNTFKDLIELEPDTFTNLNKYLRGVQTFAPVEMVAVAVLISMYSETRNNQLLLGDIKAMRISLREHFVDLRMNAHLWKFIWKFLEDLEAIRGAVDGSTVDRRVEQPLRPSGSTTVVGVSSSSLGAKGERSTARTKPPPVLPPQRSLSMKTEEDTSISAGRQTKRKRTDPGTITVPLSPSAIHHSVRLTDGTGFSAAQPCHTQPGCPPMTAYVIAPPGPQFQPQNPTPTSSPPGGNMSPFPLRTRTPMEPHLSTYVPPASGIKQQSTNYTSYRPSAAPPTSSDDRGQPVTGYRAPTAFMATSSPNALRDNQPGASHRDPAPSTVSRLHIQGNRPSEWRTGVGPFAPIVSEQQYSGILRSVTPPVQAIAIGVAPLEQPHSRQKARKTSVRPTIMQYDGAIDLTGDTEQERQNLLQIFNAKALAAKKTRMAGTSDSVAD